jgi:molybdopterin converting factor small subunit
MKITVLGFGVAQEIFDNSSASFELLDPPTAGNLRKTLESEFPEIKKIGTYMIAVNNAYAEDSVLISSKDEVAIIPPLSGG